MNVTINFHCHHCDRDGFVRVLGGEAPTKMVCPACGKELAEVQVDYDDSVIFMSRVGDSTNWDFNDEEA